MTQQRNPHTEILLLQFQQLKPVLAKLDMQVYELLASALREQNVETSAIEHRVKTEESLAGKLELKGEKYQDISDITDLVGVRIITYYTDDVDKVAVIVKKLFKVDWSNSVDKRKLHQLNSFGYNSLHYICSLRTDDEELRGIRFEIQMRTALQHVWSAIEHDIGYKGAVRLPAEFRRQFSRLAGMLELADDEFSRLRTTMNDYRRHVQALVKTGKLDEVPLSTDSFRSFLDMNPFYRLNKRIAAVNQAELFHTSLMPFLPIIEQFGIETLGDLQTFIDQDSEDAYQLALSQLAMTDLDIMSDSVGLQNLCIVHVLKQGRGAEGIKFIYDTLYSRKHDNGALAEILFNQAQTLPFMQQAIKG